MIIPQDKKTKNVIKLNEVQLRNIIRDILYEELGSFTNQYPTSCLIAKIVKKKAEGLKPEQIKKIKDNAFIEIKQKVNTENFDIVRIRLVQYQPLGVFLGLNMEQRAVIIQISYANALNMSQDDLANVIHHELMHGNTNINIVKNVGEEKFGNAPIYYNNLISIFHGEQGNSLVYNFAHALYSTHYDETNALVSQVYSSIMSEFNKSGKEQITEEEFIDLYRNTNSYQEFKLALTDTIPEIESMSNMSIEREIIKPFKCYGINFTVPQVKKYCKQIRKISNEALKDCGRNASLCYRDMIKDGLIKGKENYE